MSDFSFEIVEKIGILSTNSSGWSKEFNIVAYNGGTPKYDIRDWSPDHKKMGKGITLTKEEAQIFSALVAQMYFDEKENSDKKVNKEVNKQVKETKKEEKIDSKVVQFKPKTEQKKKVEQKIEKKIATPEVKKVQKVSNMNNIKLPF